MKLLHTKSIRECTELEEVIHQAEVERFSGMIASLPNYDCDVIVAYEDSYHKEKIPPKIFESSLNRYEDFIQNQDIKNGVDIYLSDENHLAFRTYGQSYAYQGKEDMVTSFITIKCFGEGWSPINMSKIFTPPTQELEKGLSV